MTDETKQDRDGDRPTALERAEDAVRAWFPTGYDNGHYVPLPQCLDAMDALVAAARAEALAEEAERVTRECMDEPACLPAYQKGVEDGRREAADEAIGFAVAWFGTLIPDAAERGEDIRAAWRRAHGK